MATLSELVVKIGANISGLTKGVDETETKLGKFAKGAKATSAVVSGLGVAAFGAAKKTADYAQNVSDSAVKTGMSTTAYQEMSHAFDRLGVDQKNADRGMERLNQRMGHAANGNDKYAEAFDDLGVSIQDSNGDLRDADAVMMDTIESLAGIEDPALQASMASEVLGTQLGRKMMPALQDGSAGIEELREEAHELGLVMDGDAIEAGQKFGEEMDRFQGAVKGAGMALGTALLPIFSDQVLPMITDVAVPAFITLGEKIGDLAEWFGNLSPEVQKTIGVILAIAVALGPVLAVAARMVTIFQTLAPLFRVLALAKMLFSAALWASPITWIVLGILLLIAAIVALVYYWDEVAEACGAAWDWIVEKLGEAWEWIKQLFSDLGSWLVETAVSIWEGIVDGFWTGVDWIVEAVQSGLDWLLDLFLSWHPLGIIISHWDAIVDAFDDGVEWAKDLVSDGVDSVLDFLRGLAAIPGMVGGFFSSMASAAGDRIADFLSTVAGIPGRVTSAIGNLGSLLLGAGRDIIQGLIDGVQNMVGNLRNQFSRVTNMIPDWKGPQRVDLKLLEGPGEDIMSGLSEGIEGGLPELRSTLGGVTDSIPSNVSASVRHSASGSSAQTLELDLTGADEELKKVFRKIIRNSGGNAQQVFGQR